MATATSSLFQLGHDREDEPPELDWWDVHHPLVLAWIERLAPASDIERDFAYYAAQVLLRVPEARGYGSSPEREPFTWDEIDGYEIFEEVLHGGITIPGLDAVDYLKLIGSFAAFLGEHGVIAPREWEALDAEYDVWARRALHVWDEGGWYTRDGQRLRPSPPPPATLHAAPKAARPKSRHKRPKKKRPKKRRR